MLKQIRRRVVTDGVETNGIVDLDPAIVNAALEGLELARAVDPGFELTSISLPTIMSFAEGSRAAELDLDSSHVLAALIDEGFIVLAGHSRRSRDPISIYDLPANIPKTSPATVFSGLLGFVRQF